MTISFFVYIHYIIFHQLNSIFSLPLVSLFSASSEAKLMFGMKTLVKGPELLYTFFRDNLKQWTKLFIKIHRVLSFFIASIERNSYFLHWSAPFLSLFVVRLSVTFSVFFLVYILSAFIFVLVVSLLSAIIASYCWHWNRTFCLLSIRKVFFCILWRLWMVLEMRLFVYKWNLSSAAKFV